MPHPHQNGAPQPGDRLTVRLRASGTAGTAPRLGALDDPWPDRPWREGYGWPLWIPPTSPRAYISGLFAMNLPTVPGEAHLGDWHDDGAWWSRLYLDGYDAPVRALLWGPDGDTIATPGQPAVHDARPALAQVRHPAAGWSTPVLAATIPQAIADMAWGSLHGQDQQPCRHDIVRWTNAEAEGQLRGLARAIEDRIGDPALRRRWQAWTDEALDGPDTFHDAPVATLPGPPEPARIPVVFRAEGTAR